MTLGSKRKEGGSGNGCRRDKSKYEIHRLTKAHDSSPLLFLSEARGLSRSKCRGLGPAFASSARHFLRPGVRNSGTQIQYTSSDGTRRHDSEEDREEASELETHN